MIRPTWDEYFMSLAAMASTRSTCKRRKVGAVIVRDRMVLSTGYNDTPRERVNCGDGGCSRCSSYAPPGSELHICLCVHAEQNAIVLAARNGIGVAGGTIYTTVAPCLTCAKLIIQAGIVHVMYGESYDYVGFEHVGFWGEVRVEQMPVSKGDYS